MELDKKDKMILSLLVNIQTEILTLKEYVLKSMEIVGDMPKEEKEKMLIENYEARRKEFQNSVMASLKNNFDDNLEDIGDMLSKL